MKFGRREIGKVFGCLPVQKKTKKNKISPRSPDLTAAHIAPKSTRTTLRQCTQSVPDFIQIGLLSAERVNTIKTGRKVFPMFP